MPIRTSARRCPSIVGLLTGLLMSPTTVAMAQGGTTTSTNSSAQSAKPRIPETFDEIFAARDQRAVRAIGYLWCVQQTTAAAQTGALGERRDTWTLTCLEQDGEWRGVFGEVAMGIFSVRRQYALRGVGVVITRDRLDTTRLVRTALALAYGLTAPRPGAGRYPFTPVALPQPDFVELWYLPIPGDPSHVVVGGDSLIQMSADGGRELSHGPRTPPIRELSLKRSTEPFAIESTEERIPTVSELATAHRALDLVPKVVIYTRQYASTLKRPGREWKHQRR